MTRTLRLIGTCETVTADLQNGDVQWVRFPSKETMQIENFSVGKGDNLLSETRAFLQAVTGSSSEAVTGEEGLHAMEWIHHLMNRIEAP